MITEKTQKAIARIEWYNPRLKSKYTVDLNYCTCGSKKIKPDYEKEGGFWIECQDCGKFSEQYDTLSEAVKEWNKFTGEERSK